MREREREIVCVCERERVCVWERGSERLHVCEREGMCERDRMCVCVRESDKALRGTRTMSGRSAVGWPLKPGLGFGVWGSGEGCGRWGSSGVV